MRGGGQRGSYNNDDHPAFFSSHPYHPPFPIYTFPVNNPSHPHTELLLGAIAWRCYMGLLLGASVGSERGEVTRAVAVDYYCEHVIGHYPPACYVGRRSEVSCLLRSSAMDGSSGSSYGATDLRVQGASCWIPAQR